MKSNENIYGLLNDSIKEVVKSIVQEELKKLLEINAVDKTLDDDKFIDTKEASIFLSLSIHTVRSKVQQREIPYYKIGSKTVFKKSELIGWVNNFKISTSQNVSNLMFEQISKKIKL